MLTQRLLRHPRLRFGEQIPVAPGSQAGVQSSLLDVQPQFVQPGGLDPARRPAVQISERRPPPQRQGLAEQVRGAFRRAERIDLPGPGDEAFKAEHIDLVTRQHQAIAPGCGLDRPGSEGAAETDHAGLNLLAPRRRRLLTPERIGEYGGVDDLAAPHRQRCQHHAVARRERPLVDQQRAQDRNPHHPQCPRRVHTRQPGAYRLHTGRHRQHTATRDRRPRHDEQPRGGGMRGHTTMTGLAVLAIALTACQGDDGATGTSIEA